METRLAGRTCSRLHPRAAFLWAADFPRPLAAPHRRVLQLRDRGVRRALLARRRRPVEGPRAGRPLVETRLAGRICSRLPNRAAFLWAADFPRPLAAPHRRVLQLRDRGVRRALLARRRRPVEGPRAGRPLVETRLAGRICSRLPNRAAFLWAADFPRPLAAPHRRVLQFRDSRVRRALLARRRRPVEGPRAGRPLVETRLAGRICSRLPNRDGDGAGLKKEVLQQTVVTCPALLQQLQNRLGR